MYRARTSPIPVAAALFAAGCADAPTAVPPGDVMPGGIHFVLPTLDRALLVAADAGTEPASDAGPQASDFAEGDYTYEELESYLAGEADAAGIWNASTLVSFNPDGPFAFGQHSYTGNKSRLETTVNVRYEGQSIGAQTAAREDDRSFALDFMWPKHMSVMARFFSDQQCGLSVWGGSTHTAWWEAVLGGPVANFGRVERTSQSDLDRQPDCAPPEPTYAGGGGGGSDIYVSCWYWVIYDPYSGYVYDIDLLYCEEMGG
jgi:hypothetical protein